MTSQHRKYNGYKAKKKRRILLKDKTFTATSTSYFAFKAKTLTAFIQLLIVKQTIIVFQKNKLK